MTFYQRTNSQPILLFGITGKAAGKRGKRPEYFGNNSWILHLENAPAHTALTFEGVFSY